MNQQLTYLYTKNNNFNYATISRGVFVEANNTVYGCNFKDNSRVDGHVYMLYADENGVKCLNKSGYNYKIELTANDQPLQQSFEHPIVNPTIQIYIALDNIIDNITIELYDGNSLIHSDTIKVLTNNVYWIINKYVKVNDPLIKISSFTGLFTCFLFADEIVD